ncbi:TNF receptor-associated factor 2-like [Lissotriton helveticus]
MSLLIFSPPALTERFHDLHMSSDTRGDASTWAGYPLLERHSYDRKYLCTKCELLLRDPVQNINCGHRFCLCCYQLLVRKGNLQCPACLKERIEPYEKSKNNLGQCFRDNAIKREVLNLLVSCSNKGCDWTGPLKELEEKHRSSCSSEKIDCPYKTLGCSEQVRRKDLEDHEKERVVYHQRLLKDALLSSSTLSQSVTSNLKEMKSSLVSDVDPKLGQSTVEKKLAEVEAKQKTLQNILAVLSREMGRRELAPASGGENQLSPSAEARIAILEDKVKEQDSLLVLKDMMLQGLATHLQAIQQATYDGTFIWKIDDVERKMKESCTGKRPALYSPAFYTGRYGYKVCLKLFLNGDGTGHRSHISLFLVIMKGEYDFQLAWPFLHKVVFLLMDQTNQHHVSASFRPSSGSASFQQPVTPMNVASGIPEFVSLDLIHTGANNYLQDNTMVIKAVIDTSS